MQNRTNNNAIRGTNIDRVISEIQPNIGDSVREFITERERNPKLLAGDKSAFADLKKATWEKCGNFQFEPALNLQAFTDMVDKSADTLSPFEYNELRCFCDSMLHYTTVFALFSRLKGDLENLNGHRALARAIIKYRHNSAPSPRDEYVDKIEQFMKERFQDFDVVKLDTTALRSERPGDAAYWQERSAADFPMYIRNAAETVLYNNRSAGVNAVAFGLNMAHYQYILEKIFFDMVRREDSENHATELSLNQRAYNEMRTKLLEMQGREMAPISQDQLRGNQPHNNRQGYGNTRGYGNRQGGASISHWGGQASRRDSQSSNATQSSGRNTVVGFENQADWFDITKVSADLHNAVASVVAMGLEDQSTANSRRNSNASNISHTTRISNAGKSHGGSNTPLQAVVPPPPGFGVRGSNSTVDWFDATGDSDKSADQGNKKNNINLSNIQTPKAHNFPGQIDTKVQPATKYTPVWAMKPGTAEHDNLKKKYHTTIGATSGKPSAQRTGWRNDNTLKPGEEMPKLEGYDETGSDSETPKKNTGWRK